MEHDMNMQRSVTPSAMIAANDSMGAQALATPPARVSGPVALRQFRMSKRESQATFWARFGVTQSSGSRFETGLGVPPAVALLVKLYANGKLSDGDLLG